jgi:transposase
MIARDRIRKGYFKALKRSYWWIKGNSVFGLTDKDIDRIIGRHRKTTTLCSCYMCGNPRHRFKGDDRFTLQERRFIEGNRRNSA